MDAQKFSRIAESLRQYRRAELKDFGEDVSGQPIDQLYVDPLPSNAIVSTVKSGNTTFILGRKGTGKSTVFAKAQSDIRKQDDLISCYIDVKSLHDLTKPADISSSDEVNLNHGIYRTHLLRKAFLGSVLSQVIKELKAASQDMSLWDRWAGRQRSIDELEERLTRIEKSVKNAKLENQELPILQRIQTRWRAQTTDEQTTETSASAKIVASPTFPRAEAQADTKDFERTLDDREIYDEYSRIVLSTFPYEDIISEIKSLLDESSLRRLIIFFDDFSELSFLDQRLFVDIILSPLNNSSNELIKLKVAGYPGRVYYGSIDPTKIDRVNLDFSSLYETTDVQSMESAAIDYTTRLIKTRFSAFDAEIEDYFDSGTPISEHMRTLFQTTFNVPRLMGSLLQYCYLDRISKNQKITPSSLRLAARKYYESTLNTYFDMLNKFALEPFDNKLDRHNQKKLLEFVVGEMRNIRKKIADGTVGGSYFNKLSVQPVSHFYVSSSFSDIFNALEANFLVSRYKDTRDKDGRSVTVFALYYGLTELERIAWGYPEGREYRNYFVQRCFDLTTSIQSFLSSKQTIRCNGCKTSFPLETRASLELYKWKCPECADGVCSIVNIADDFSAEIDEIKQDLQLEPVELEILNTLQVENRPMAAGEISSLIDVTYQLVGRRTAKLQDKGFVKKSQNNNDKRVRSEILEKASDLYFS
ncbi:MarR family transcriptional regulator [Maricaulis maris]|uniref:MarR family protein n=1 Tax=Maricaulis maris TaxID=74318 RepID=A0A495DLZ4_9PROT|nr:MarR family transcriptional regulator [Maricaulis maris]RKR03947.1 MarR family protein [Maricaulis maris]